MALGSSPMGMGWMTGWYFGAPYWFYNLRRSYSSYHSKLFNISITKLHWRICEIKMIPIRITLVKWWWTTRNGRREAQCSSTTLCGCLCTYATHLMLSSVTNCFKWDILLFIISDPKSCCLCACHNSKTNFIPQPQEQKSGRRQTQCSSTLCGC